MLQHDQMARTGADILRLLHRRIGQWRDGHFDLLVQEADHCDSGLKHSCRVNLTGDDVVRIFSRLMLQGKVKAAVRWATEHTRRELLMPTDVVDNTSGTTVLDVLRQKHPSARPPKASSLVPCDVLPLFEDVEITGSHLLFVAHRIQGVLDLVVVMLVIGGTCCSGLVLIAPDFVMLLLPWLADY